jgi:hypothetical protein
VSKKWLSKPELVWGCEPELRERPEPEVNTFADKFAILNSCVILWGAISVFPRGNSKIKINELFNYFFFSIFL